MKTSEVGIKANSHIFFNTPSNQTKKLFYYVTCTGHFYYDDFYKLKRDSYESFLIMYIVKGSAKVNSAKGSCVVHSGDTVFMNCYYAHGYEAIGELETLWFHFDGINSKEIYKELDEQYHGFIVLQHRFSMIEKVNKIYMMYENNKKVSESIQSSCISRIIAEFFHVHTEMNNSNTSIIEDIANYIDEHFMEELSLKHLAMKASLSEFYFSRLFKRETGFTIHEYIIKTRINNAKNMLQLSNFSLKEIAYRCGFSNESGFSTSFKKHTGVTPGVFRNMKF